MVPVALIAAVGALDYKQGRAVLAADVCASPGSKTSQLLEILDHKCNGDYAVIANDADRKRAAVSVGHCDTRWCLACHRMCVKCNGWCQI